MATHYDDKVTEVPVRLSQNKPSAAVRKTYTDEDEVVFLKAIPASNAQVSSFGRKEAAFNSVASCLKRSGHSPWTIDAKH